MRITNINLIYFGGTLTDAPSVKNGDLPKAVARLANHRYVPLGDGKFTEYTNFATIIAYGRDAERLGQAHKGDAVIGIFQLRTYERQTEDGRTLRGFYLQALPGYVDVLPRGILAKPKTAEPVPTPAESARIEQAAAQVKPDELDWLF